MKSINIYIVLLFSSIVFLIYSNHFLDLNPVLKSIISVGQFICLILIVRSKNNSKT